MPKVIADNGDAFDAEYSVEEFQNVSGLILESWGPSTRNSDYNPALDFLLGRLQIMGLPSVSINVISRNLVKKFPDFNDRAGKLNGKDNLSLSSMKAKELRIAVGAQQARLKVNPKTKGGNRTKRILLHSPLVEPGIWLQIASGTHDRVQFLGQLAESTADIDELDRRVSKLIQVGVEPPRGSTKPATVSTSTTAFVRDPSVKAWVLQGGEAQGICEFCHSTAPFVRDDGQPFLEVHHVKPLSEGGSDTSTNAMALCPNCHRRMHYGSNRLELRNDAVKKLNDWCENPAANKSLQGTFDPLPILLPQNRHRLKRP